MFSCIYYNLYVASSVTTQGRSCNAAAALLFESILNNNVPFSSFNELVTFIHNIKNEKRTFSDYEILDRDITIEECFYKLITSCGFDYIPSDKEMNIVWEMIVRLDQITINRLFYKNNLFNFVDNKNVKTALIGILAKLNVPFVDPNEPPKEIQLELDIFYDLLFEYVYYDKQIIDRLEKMDSLIRSVSIIQDTDSAIISLDGWYNYVLQKTINIPLEIKSMSIDQSSDNEKIKIKKVQEYDFLLDEIIELETTIDSTKVIPQNALRYSIINIMAYCIGKMVNDFMSKYAINSNSNSDRACLLVLKNEYLFRRVLITEGKKHYATYQELQEGNIIPEDKAADFKGLEAFTKTSMNETTREALRKIMTEDILKNEEVDRIKLLRDIAKVEKDIFNSIQAGEKKYFKPVKVKSMSSYENPMRIQGIKASLAYNAIHDPGTEALNLEIRNSIDVVKVSINMKNVDSIKDKFPETYEKMLNLLISKEFNGVIDSIAIPLNESVPKWILPFINYATIINDNVSQFPLESIGLYRGNKSNNYTNIINF